MNAVQIQPTPSVTELLSQFADKVLPSGTPAIVERLRREAAIRRAIREFNSLSDRELDELGVGRGAIPNLVRHGRPAR